MQKFTRRLSSTFSFFTRGRKKSKFKENEEEDGVGPDDRERSRSRAAPTDDMKIASNPVKGMKLRSGSAASIGGRAEMEDEHICVNGLSLLCPKGPCRVGYFGVFDGHAGRAVAEYAQRNLFKMIATDSEFPQRPENSLKNAFAKLDETVHLTGLQGGATAIVALVVGRTLYIANAGDCRAVLVHKKGKFSVMSRDHKASDSTERSRIEELGGYVDPYGYLSGRINIARAFGDWTIKNSFERSPLISEPEIKSKELEDEDQFLILACDGVWDELSCEEAVNIAGKVLGKNGNPELAAKALLNEAIEKRSKDNLTAVVVCISLRSSVKRRFCW